VVNLKLFNTRQEYNIANNPCASGNTVRVRCSLFFESGKARDWIGGTGLSSRFLTKQGFGDVPVPLEKQLKRGSYKTTGLRVTGTTSICVPYNKSRQADDI
jgi:hypothetical protein